MNVVRSIVYTYDFKSWYKRYVGQTLDVRVEGDVKKMTIDSMNVRREPDRGFFVEIFVRNDNNEIALWKEVSCSNIEIEYVISDLLTDNY